MPNSYVFASARIQLYFHSVHVAAYHWKFNDQVLYYPSQTIDRAHNLYHGDTTVAAQAVKMATNPYNGNMTAAVPDLQSTQDERRHNRQHISMVQFESFNASQAIGNGAAMILFSGAFVMCLFCSWPKLKDCIQVPLDGASAAVVGKPPPDFVMTLLDRSDQRITELVSLGKPMVLRFYISRGVQPYSSYARDVKSDCDEGVKALAEMAEDIKYYQKVLFVLVAIDHPGTTDLQAYNDRMRISDKNMIINAELKRGWDKALGEYCVEDLPHTTVIDANGLVVKNFGTFGAYLVDLRQCVNDVLHGRLQANGPKQQSSQERLAKQPKQKGPRRQGRL